MLGEGAVAGKWCERGVDDVLGQAGIAADVAFAEAVQHLRRHLAEDVAEVEIGVGDWATSCPHTSHR